MKPIVLAAGPHTPADSAGCAMEWVGVKWLMSHGYSYRDAWLLLDDSPRCTDDMISLAVQRVNDRLNDEDRQRLIPFLDRIQRCHSPADKMARRRVRTRVACWSARKVAYLIRDDERRAVALRAIETAEAWLCGDATTEDCAGAAVAVAASASTSYGRAFAASSAASDAAYASAYDAAYASSASAASAFDAAADSLLAFLDELLDQWEKACAAEGTLAEEPPVPEGKP